jgi:hypothetical protein
LRITSTVGLALVLLIAGCSNKPAPQEAQSPVGAATAPAQPAGMSSAARPAAPPASTSIAATSTTTANAGAATPAAKAPAATAATAPGNTGQNAASPSAKAPAAANSKSSAVANAKAPVAPPPAKKESAPPAVAKAAPTLDIAALTQRLKDTKAIGVLSKLALKNQVDDLLDQFRAFYQGKLKTTLAELRRPYDLLVLKVLALLQDSDPSLAAEIVASREAMWGILSDPKKFATVA